MVIEWVRNNYGHRNGVRFTSRQCGPPPAPPLGCSLEIYCGIQCDTMEHCMFFLRYYLVSFFPGEPGLKPHVCGLYLIKSQVSQFSQLNQVKSS